MSIIFKYIYRFCGRWLGIAGPSISIPRFTYNAVNAAKTLCTQGKPPPLPDLR